MSVLSSCAFAPGMRVGDLPPSGHVVMDNGINLKIESLNVANVSASSVDQADSSDLNNLFSVPTSSEYRLAAGDVLSINLWANPEITPTMQSATGVTGFVVSQDGCLLFPLVGCVPAAGETVRKFTNLLNQKLSAYLKQPDANVKVVQFNGHRFFVGGAVKSPGEFAMTNQPQTLLTALSNGGATPETDLNNIVLTRNGQQYFVGLDYLQSNHLSPSHLFLHDDDRIYFYSKENKKVYLIGEVGQPMALLIPDQGLSLAAVIGEARGLSALGADAAKVYVVRDDAVHNQATIYHMDLSNIGSLALADRFVMRPHDVVYVDASGLVRWNRVLSLLLPATQGAVAVGQTSYYAKTP